MRISATPMRKYAYQGGTFILFISYFRLADYLQPLEDNHSLHTFKSDATFEDAVTLYYFDKELRSLIFTAIGGCYTPRKHVPHKIKRTPCQISFSGYCGNGVPL